uniref:Uncharacterized protein n=1 Tax=Rhizochromulina marina TaxID=1034831 RepID=A0A7S2S9R2_9STRA
MDPQASDGAGAGTKKAAPELASANGSREDVPGDLEGVGFELRAQVSEEEQRLALHTFKMNAIEVSAAEMSDCLSLNGALEQENMHLRKGLMRVSSRLRPALAAVHMMGNTVAGTGATTVFQPEVLDHFRESHASAEKELQAVIEIADNYWRQYDSPAGLSATPGSALADEWAITVTQSLSDSDRAALTPHHQDYVERATDARQRDLAIFRGRIDQTQEEYEGRLAKQEEELAGLHDELRRLNDSMSALLGKHASATEHIHALSLENHELQEQLQASGDQRTELDALEFQLKQSQRELAKARRMQGRLHQDLALENLEGSEDEDLEDAEGEEDDGRTSAARRVGDLSLGGDASTIDGEDGDDLSGRTLELPGSVGSDLGLTEALRCEAALRKRVKQLRRQLSKREAALAEQREANAHLLGKLQLTRQEAAELRAVLDVKDGTSEPPPPPEASQDPVDDPDEELQQALQSARSDAALARQETQLVRGELGELEAAHEALEQECDQLREAVDAAAAAPQDELAAARSQIADLEQELADADGQVEDLRRDLEEREELLAKQTGKVHELAKQESAARATAEDLTGRLRDGMSWVLGTSLHHWQLRVRTRAWNKWRRAAHQAESRNCESLALEVQDLSLQRRRAEHALKAMALSRFANAAMSARKWALGAAWRSWAEWSTRTSLEAEDRLAAAMSLTRAALRFQRGVLARALVSWRSSATSAQQAGVVHVAQEEARRRGLAACLLRAARSEDAWRQAALRRCLSTFQRNLVAGRQAQDAKDLACRMLLRAGCRGERQAKILAWRQLVAQDQARRRRVAVARERTRAGFADQLYKMESRTRKAWAHWRTAVFAARRVDMSSDLGQELAALHEQYQAQLTTQSHQHQEAVAAMESQLRSRYDQKASDAAAQMEVRQRELSTLEDAVEGLRDKLLELQGQLGWSRFKAVVLVRTAVFAEGLQAVVLRAWLRWRSQAARQVLSSVEERHRHRLQQAQAESKQLLEAAKGDVQDLLAVRLAQEQDARRQMEQEVSGLVETQIIFESALNEARTAEKLLGRDKLRLQATVAALALARLLERSSQARLVAAWRRWRRSRDDAALVLRGLCRVDRAFCRHHHAASTRAFQRWQRHGEQIEHVEDVRRTRLGGVASHVRRSATLQAWRQWRDVCRFEVRRATGVVRLAQVMERWTLPAMGAPPQGRHTVASLTEALRRWRGACLQRTVQSSALRRLGLALRQSGARRLLRCWQRWRSVSADLAAQDGHLSSALGFAVSSRRRQVLQTVLHGWGQALEDSKGRQAAARSVLHCMSRLYTHRLRSALHHWSWTGRLMTQESASTWSLQEQGAARATAAARRLRFARLRQGFSALVRSAQVSTAAASLLRLSLLILSRVQRQRLLAALAVWRHWAQTSNVSLGAARILLGGVRRYGLAGVRRSFQTWVRRTEVARAVGSLAQMPDVPEAGGSTEEAQSLRATLADLAGELAAKNREVAEERLQTATRDRAHRDAAESLAEQLHARELDVARLDERCRAFGERASDQDAALVRTCERLRLRLAALDEAGKGAAAAAALVQLGPSDMSLPGQNATGKHPEDDEASGGQLAERALAALTDAHRRLQRDLEASSQAQRHLEVQCQAATQEKEEARQRCLVLERASGPEAKSGSGDDLMRELIEGYKEKLKASHEVLQSERALHAQAMEQFEERLERRNERLEALEQKLGETREEKLQMVEALRRTEAEAAAAVEAKTTEQGAEPSTSLEPYLLQQAGAEDASRVLDRHARAEAINSQARLEAVQSARLAVERRLAEAEESLQHARKQADETAKANALSMGQLREAEEQLRANEGERERLAGRLAALESARDGSSDEVQYLQQALQVARTSAARAEEALSQALERHGQEARTLRQQVRDLEEQVEDARDSAATATRDIRRRVEHLSSQVEGAGADDPESGRGGWGVETLLAEVDLLRGRNLELETEVRRLQRGREGAVQSHREAQAVSDLLRRTLDISRPSKEAATPDRVSRPGSRFSTPRRRPGDLEGLEDRLLASASRRSAAEERLEGLGAAPEAAGALVDQLRIELSATLDCQQQAERKVAWLEGENQQLRNHADSLASVHESSAEEANRRHRAEVHSLQQELHRTKELETLVTSQRDRLSVETRELKTSLEASHERESAIRTRLARAIEETNSMREVSVALEAALRDERAMRARIADEQQQLLSQLEELEKRVSSPELDLAVKENMGVNQPPVPAQDICRLQQQLQDMARALDDRDRLLKTLRLAEVSAVSRREAVAEEESKAPGAEGGAALRLRLQQAERTAEDTTAELRECTAKLNRRNQEVASLKDALTKKQHEVRGLVQINEELLKRAERLLERTKTKRRRRRAQPALQEPIAEEQDEEDDGPSCAEENSRIAPGASPGTVVVIVDGERLEGTGELRYVGKPSHGQRPRPRSNALGDT